MSRHLCCSLVVEQVIYCSVGLSEMGDVKLKRSCVLGGNCFRSLMKKETVLHTSGLQVLQTFRRSSTGFVATFSVARSTLQTRKLWLVGGMSRPTLTRVTFDLPECIEL